MNNIIYVTIILYHIACTYNAKDLARLFLILFCGLFLKVLLKKNLAKVIIMLFRTDDKNNLCS